MLLIDFYKIPVAWALGATAAILATTMILSLMIPPKAEPARPGTSSLEGAPAAKLVRASKAPEDNESRSNGGA